MNTIDPIGLDACKSAEIAKLVEQAGVAQTLICDWNAAQLDLNHFESGQLVLDGRIPSYLLRVR